MDGIVKHIIQCGTFEITSVFLPLGGFCEVCGKNEPRGLVASIYCTHCFKHVVCVHCATRILGDRETLIFQAEIDDATKSMKSIVDKFKSRLKGGC